MKPMLRMVPVGVARSARVEAADEIRLFCLPHAGGTPAVFRAWPRLASDRTAVYGYDLPGQGARFREKAFDELQALVDALLVATAPLLDRPFVLFGHSLGGLLAFELAHALRRAGLPAPRLAALSACRPPERLDRRGRRRVATLSDDELVAELRRLGGTPEKLLDDAELRPLILPRLRSELGMLDDYVSRTEAPLDAPILALAGEDDAMVPPAICVGWRRHTRAAFSLEVLPGDRFFHVADPKRVVATLQRAAVLPGADPEAWRA